MIEVTQADRDAACELLGGAATEAMRLGKGDSLSLIQALARHRTEAQAGLIEALEEAERGFRFLLQNGEAHKIRVALARVKGEQS